MIGNDYTFSFAGQRYQIERAQVQAGMRHQRLRVELRLDGELKARYQGRYLSIARVRRSRAVRPARAGSRKPVRKDHNAGGKSSWMQGFFDRPEPAAVEVDRRSEVNPIRAQGAASSLMPKASAREFHQKQWSSYGRPSSATG